MSEIFVVSAATLLAQDSPKTTHKKVRTLSGCLQKGDGEKEYKLTDAKGDSWEIKSDAVALGEHVGHTVRVTAWCHMPRCMAPRKMRRKGQMSTVLVTPLNMVT